MTPITTPATTLEEASLRLDGRLPLRPGTLEYERYYIERPRVESQLLREAKRARQAERPFHWFFTGHTGSGKSTELFRILAQDALKGDYETVYLDLGQELDVRNVDYTDLILIMAKGCLAKAETLKVKLDKRLRETIEHFGEEIIHERETMTKTEGQAGLKIPLIGLGEEIRSGGGRRELVRKTIAANLIELVRVIDGLAQAIEDASGRGLCACSMGWIMRMWRSVLRACRRSSWCRWRCSIRRFVP